MLEEAQNYSIKLSRLGQEPLESDPEMILLAFRKP